jgi:hypothetical protein
MRELRETRFHGLTVWRLFNSPHDKKWQINVQYHKGGGWTVVHANDVEDGIEEAMRTARIGEGRNDPAPPAIVARDRIRAAADPDDDEPAPRRERATRDDPPRSERKTRDDPPDLFGGRRERNRR